MGCEPERLLVGRVDSLVLDAGLDGGRFALTQTDASLLCPPATTPLTSRGATAVGDSSPYAGRWRAALTGWEADKFPSEELEIDLVATGQSTLRLMTTPLPPPASAGSKGYLCSSNPSVACTGDSGFIGGFNYPLGNLSTRAGALAFSLFLNTPWQAWCQLQTPQLRDVGASAMAANCPPAYSVGLASQTNNDEGECFIRRGEEAEPIDCQRLATLERNPCDCDAQQCWASARRSLKVSLRLTSAQQLQGSLWFDGDHALALDLQRTTPP